MSLVGWRGLFIVLVLGSFGAAAQQPYRVVDNWKIGGAGGWDYLLADPVANLLYVTRGPKVVVVDTKTGKVAGEIGGMKGTHGVALDDIGKFGYISDGGSNAVVVFDRSNFKMVATVPAGTNPDGIVFEPLTKTVWAFNGRSKNVTVIDTATNAVVATIALPGKPEFPTVDGKGAVYDNIEDQNEIVRLDTKTRTLTATWKLTECESPSGMAIDVANGHLFSVCDGKKMAVVDTASGKQIASPMIGDGPDAAGFDAKGELAFSSNGGGTLTVVDAAHGFKVLGDLATTPSARTMTYDSGTDRIYLSSATMGPRPAATAENPHPRPTAVADSFTIVVVGR